MDLMAQIKAAKEAAAARKAAKEAETASHATMPAEVAAPVEAAAQPQSSGYSVDPAWALPKAAPAPAPTSEPTPAAPTPTIAGLKPPVRRIVSRAVVTSEAPSQPVASVAPVTGTAPPPEPAATPAEPAKLSPLDRLRGVSRGTVAAPRGTPAINPNAAAAAAHGPTYSAEQFLEDLQEVEQEELDEDYDPEAIANRDKARADVLKRGTDYLNEIFTNHMHDLQTAGTSDFAVAEMAKIVKITFMRVKSAPNAWAIMDLTDKSHIIRAMTVMATKRHGESQKFKKTEAKVYADDADVMSSPTKQIAGLDEAMSALGDLGGLDGFGI